MAVYLAEASEEDDEIAPAVAVMPPHGATSFLWKQRGVAFERKTGREIGKAMLMRFSFFLLLVGGKCLFRRFFLVTFAAVFPRFYVANALRYTQTSSSA